MRINKYTNSDKETPEDQVASLCCVVLLQLAFVFAFFSSDKSFLRSQTSFVRPTSLKGGSYLAGSPCCRPEWQPAFFSPCYTSVVIVKQEKKKTCSIWLLFYEVTSYFSRSMSMPSELLIVLKKLIAVELLLQQLNML